MIATVLLAFLLGVTPSVSVAADDLAPATLGKLRLMVPAAWKYTVEADSHRYDSPSEDASFQLSVFPVEPKRTGKLCVDQLLRALGGDGDWARTRIGASPAALKVEVETSASSDENGLKGLPIKVQTNSYVGCDGSTKWVLTMTMNTKKRDRFEALVKKIVESVTYVKSGK